MELTKFARAPALGARFSKAESSVPPPNEISTLTPQACAAGTSACSLLALGMAWMLPSEFGCANA